MKKIFMTLLVGAAIVSAKAQMNSVLLYGNLGYSSDKTTTLEDRQTKWNINPGIGYQFNDNWTVGINLVLGGSSTPTGVAGKYDRTNDFNAGPFLRYTKGFTSLFGMWHQVNLSYLSTNTIPNVGTQTRNTGVGFEYIPAIALNLYKGFALNFGIGGLSYSSRRDDIANAKNRNKFAITFGQQFHFGISKNFASRAVKRP
jgi:hypothetical protein